MNTRKIIHLDLDAFFCSVEEQLNPSLAGKPFAVGGRPGERGVVASCSYAARQFGIRSAMPMSIALQNCPHLIIITSHHHQYSQISHKVMQLIQNMTPLVEQISIDEAFLDVSDKPEEAGDLAGQLQSTVRSTLGLPCSLGVASNKLVAKIATDVGKLAAKGNSPPNAITIVPPGREAEFLAPLPVQSLWGVGPKSADKLKSMGIHTIGDLAGYQVSELIRIFGKTGQEFFMHAQGIDERPIVTFHETKSISQEVTFSRDEKDYNRLTDTLRELSEGVSKRLQHENHFGSTVKLKLRWSDFTTITRQVTLSQPTDMAQLINQSAQDLLEKNYQPGQPIRLIGVGVTGLCSHVYQLSLWEKPSVPKTDVENVELQEAVKGLQERYGKNIVIRGSDLKPKK